MLPEDRKSERIRDPIHDIIVFQHDDALGLDMAVWDILQKPDVQRLRRIKQLGISEFVYPAATHSRFVHSVGVFNYARRLVKIIQREIALKRVAGEFDVHRAKVAVLAAMLHDIGHGPFSHAFEEARKAIARNSSGSKAKIEKHEVFSARMIEDPESGFPDILSKVGVNSSEVADLIRAETPTDMYHAIVSSSFDADRLDYLQRDRYMTGVGAGAIDLEWLMDNVRVAEIDVTPPADESSNPVYTHSFCLNYKARDAAEDFLLSRYRLYTNVYFHKTTRGIEQMISGVFKLAAEAAESGKPLAGLSEASPVHKFFLPGGETLSTYRALDDAIVLSAFQSIATSGVGLARDLCGRILERRKPYCLDIQITFPDDMELQRRLKHQLDREFSEKLEKTVFRDTAKLSLYGSIGADDGRAHKRLMIQLKTGYPKEITDFRGSLLQGSDGERPFERYYFLSESDCSKAEGIVETVRNSGRR